MANVEPPHPESPISPAISDIEDPTTPPILARLRELSRSLDEVDIISDEEASNEMLAQYKPRNARDETVRILRSFIDNLPVKGKRMLTKYINVSNDDNLFDLAHHLQTTILIPCTYVMLPLSFFFWFYYSVVNTLSHSQGTRWKDATGHCVTLVSNRYYKR